MKKQLAFLSIILLGALPLVSSAASYHYIDLNGEIVTIEANNAAEALIIAQANSNTDLSKSGVKLDQGVLEDGGLAGVMYQYVDVYGNIQLIIAINPEVALILPADIAPNSGVQEVALMQDSAE